MGWTSRRVLASAAVALVVMAGLAALVAAAAPDRTFTFAQPHAGDRWSYSLEPGPGWTYGANDTRREGVAAPGYDLSWTSPVQVRLPDGRLHDAARLDVAGVVHEPPLIEGSIADDGRHWRDYARSAWLGQDGLLALEVGGSQGAAAGSGSGPVFSQSQGVTTYAVVTDYAPERGLCFSDPPAAGRTVSLDGPVHVLRPCHFAGLLVRERGAWLRAGPVEEAAGVQALRFDGDGLRLWFHPSIPYPVQVHIDATADAGASVLRMTGFAAGTGPLRVKDTPADGLEKLELAAPVTWGPDDAGVGVDFPLSEAFQRARDEPGYSDLRDYLARHPDAFATSGFLLIEQRTHVTGPVTQPVGESRTWSVSLNAPTGCFDFSVARHVTRAEPVPSLGPLPVELPGESQDTTYEFDTQPYGCIEESFLADKPVAPASWPTVASALDWWQAFANPAERSAGPNGWVFFMRHDGDRWIQEMSVGQAAGAAQRTTTMTSVSVTGVGGAGGSLDLADGQVVSYSRVTNDFSRSQSVAGLETPTSFTADAGPSGGAVVSSPPPLDPFTPATVTTIGLVAAVAGALYLLWPWLKAFGAVGLFSRLAAPRLLEHPMRRELMQRIEAQPGIHYQDLVRAMGKGRGGVEHHLRKLQDGGLVKALAAGGYTCWFPVAYDRRLAAAAPALKSPGARALMAAIRARPGASAREVAAATGLSPAAVNHHLQRLGAAGLVEVLRAGRSLALHPTALAAQMPDASAAAA